MGYISSFTIIRSLSLVHLTAAYLFLTAPQVLVEQNITVILGESMNIAPATAFTKPTEATALVGVVLAFLAITDLISASLPERTAFEYWSTQLPIRLFMLFSMTGFIYLTGGDSNTAAATLRAIKGNSSPLDLLKNSLLFTACFMEVCTWFWAFTAMKEDRREWMLREAQAHLRAEEEKKMRL